ncbi:MAG: DUF4105 domain-containing protein [Bacteroidales bacterium]|jgi:hypothetical protein|nr:DUF4105 domain-containing protein [Bacteroidales bacterium]
MLQLKVPLIITVFTCISFLGLSQPFQLSENAEISVLTCAPGNEVYSVYGHSAFRVKDTLYNYDMVFNYGIFDFSTPNFVYRFAAGQTDYLLGANKFDVFLDSYIHENRSIFEQVLNLTHTSKQKIFEFLIWNAQPENRVYRYNFFFDNCASRIRDVIEQQIETKVVFTNQPEESKTFRQLIKIYHSKLLWLNFGVDLVVSAPADKIASVSEEMFLPDYVMKHFSTATINTHEGEKPLVKSSQVIFQAAQTDFKSLKIISPFSIFGLLFLFVLSISVWQLIKGKISAWPDYLVYSITGLTGTIMLWFVLFSEHPAMSPNYNIMWAVPVNIVFAILWKVKKWRPKLQYYHVIISCWLILFMLTELFLPQKFHPVHILFVFMILSRSILYSIFIFKKKPLNYL